MPARVAVAKKAGRTKFDTNWHDQFALHKRAKITFMIMTCLSKHSLVNYREEEGEETMGVLDIPGLQQIEHEQHERNRNLRLMQIRWARERMRQERFLGDLDAEVERLTFLVNNYHLLTTQEEQDEYRRRYFWARHQMILEDFEGNGHQRDERLNYLMATYNELHSPSPGSRSFFWFGLVIFVSLILWNFINYSDIL